MRVYADGVHANTSSLGSIGSIESAYAVSISHASYPFNGRLDEVRLRNALSSAAWVAAVHANIATPEGFYTVVRP